MSRVKIFLKALIRKPFSLISKASGLTKHFTELHSTNEKLLSEIRILREAHEKLNELVLLQGNILNRKQRESDRIQILEKKKRLKIRFFVQVSESWSSVSSPYEAFKRDPNCDTQVVLLDFIHDSKNEKSVRDFLAKKNVPFTHQDFYRIKEDCPDVVFFQIPYDSTRSQEFSSSEVASTGCLIAYIPYGLEIGGGQLNTKYMFDLPIHNLAWKIFVRSRRHSAMFGKYCSKGNSHTAITGHPKFDALSDISLMPSLDDKLESKIKNRKVVIWNPHFSMSEEMNFSTYEKFKDTIFDYFHTHKDMALIFRPHPLLFPKLFNENLMNSNQKEMLIVSLDSTDNIYYDGGAEYASKFLRSDAMMSDTSSFILEYLAVNKPLLHLKNENQIPLNDDADVTELLQTAQSPEEIHSFLEMVRLGKDPKIEIRSARREEFIYKLDGGAGERIKDTVLSSFNS